MIPVRFLIPNAGLLSGFLRGALGVGRRQALHLAVDAVDVDTGRDVAADVQRGAAHVQDTVYAKDDRDTLGRHPDRGHDQHHEGEGAARDSGGADGGEDREDHDDDLLTEVAQRTGGSYFPVTSGEELNAAFEEIANRMVLRLVE